MELSIIILNYNGERFIDRCCAELLKHLPEIESEVILLDNHSVDKSVEIVEERYTKIKVIRCNKNFGVAEGRNIAAQIAKGRYLLFLDHDTFIKENTIQKMLNTFQIPNVGVVGCKLINENGSIQPSAKRFPRLSREIFTAFMLNRIFKNSKLSYVVETDKISDVDWVSEACMMIRKDLFFLVGKFDSRFFYGAEGADLCYRIIKAGFRVIYTPEAEAIHVAFGSNMQVTSEAYSNPLKARIEFFRKHYPDVNIKFLKFVIFIQILNELFLWCVYYLIKPENRIRARIALKERMMRLQDLVRGRL